MSGPLAPCGPCLSKLCPSCAFQLGLLRGENARLREGLIALVGETEPETLRQMVSLLTDLGRISEATACAALLPPGEPTPAEEAGP